MSVDLSAAIAAASRVGPYFAIDRPDTERRWISFATLFAEPDLVRERVGVARTVLQQRTGTDVDLRACASITHLGLASRLLAPALATAAISGVVPEFDAARTLWSPVDGGPVPVAVDDPVGHEVDGAASAAEALHRSVIGTVAGPLSDVWADAFGLSAHVLNGNLASALAGAATMLARTGEPTTSPVAIVTAALSLGRLHDAGAYQPFQGAQFFVRNNCCLFWKIPAGGKCGDCVLVPQLAREDGWSEQVRRQAATG